MSRFVCVHGHFYQPPRENPWLEAIEREDTAQPYHDWNERITAECYRPNAAARVLDETGYIQNIVNNYASISFNFGPTLLAWLEGHAPEVYARILEADRESMRRCSGHGNALAQAYSHMILPLALPRDVRTQVVWGVADFRHRFGRDPEGMWLPETAVDLPALEVLADAGIGFTVLAPHQAVRMRPLEGGSWTDVRGGRIDPTRPYLVRLPSGRAITVFVYDGPIARAVAFEGLLARGERYAERLMGAFDDAREHAQLVHVATDGETYGHHHRHGDMALACALRRLAASGVTLTNYGAYLERYPPAHEVEILEGSSWSCAHGVERWRADCGCHTGAHPEWNQAWRAPLREALDALREKLDALYVTRAGRLFEDPWAARDAYIEVILNREASSVEAFLSRQAGRRLGDQEATEALALLELQRHAMLMYTSCGWFFDDISGLESVQVLRYAARAAQLAHDLDRTNLHGPLEDALVQARSNRPEVGDGGAIYRHRVLPAVVGLSDAARWVALRSVAGEEKEAATLYAHRVEREARRRRSAGGGMLEVGRVRVTSEATWQSGCFAYGAVHMEGGELAVGLRACAQAAWAERWLEAAEEPFRRGDVPTIRALLKRSFECVTVGLDGVFAEERVEIAMALAARAEREARSCLDQLYQAYAPLLELVREEGVPVPVALRAAAAAAVEGELRDRLALDPDPEAVRALWARMGNWGLEPHSDGLVSAVERAIERAVADAARAQDLATLERLAGLIRFASDYGLPVDLHHVQNTWHALLQAHPPGEAAKGGAHRGRWHERACELAGLLGLRVTG